MPRTAGGSTRRSQCSSHEPCRSRRGCFAWHFSTETLPDVEAATVLEENFSSPIVQALLTEWADAIAAKLGYMTTGGSTVAANDFVPPRGTSFAALLSTVPVGCAGLRRLDDHTGEVKRLFVREAARRQGVGRALLGAIDDHSRRVGLQRLRLDTNSDQALALFESVGYKPIRDYNGNAYACCGLEKRIVP